MAKLDLTNIRAAIFDMDGTMVDNIEHHKKAWQGFLKKFNISVSDEEFRTTFFGKSNSILFPMAFGKEMTKEEIKEMAEEKEALYRELYKRDIKPVPGLHDLLNQLKQKGIKVVTATMAPEKNRALILDALNLNSTFDLIVGAEHVIHGKPHPEIFLKAAEELKVKPTQCLVFEDSPSGIEAAKRAGIKVIAVLTSHSKEELKDADMVIKNFEELEIG